MNNIPENRVKLLAVDDEPTIRTNLASYFTRRGYTVFTADSAESALPIIKEREPEIMLLDINLPAMNGFDLLKIVRQFNKAIKVILISGYDSIEEDDSLLKELDVAKFLYKPLCIFELESAVKKAVCPTS